MGEKESRGIAWLGGERNSGSRGGRKGREGREGREERGSVRNGDRWREGEGEVKQRDA